MGAHPHICAWGIRLSAEKRWGETRIYSLTRIAYTESEVKRNKKKEIHRKENAMNAFETVVVLFALRLVLPIGLLLLLGELVRGRETHRRYG